MSGKRQHFIPRFLLEGFVCEPSLGPAQAWVYWPETIAYRTNITNIAVEGRFYSDENDKALDNAITQEEERFSDLVKDLRSRGPGQVLDANIPALLAHLETRTRHLRLTFADAGEQISAGMIQFLEDDRVFLPWIEREFISQPGFFREAAQKTVRELGLPRRMVPVVVARMNAEKPEFRRVASGLLRELASRLRRDLPKVIATASKSGHLKALLQGTMPAWKVETYRELRFELVEQLDSGLILGDCPVVFKLGPSSFTAFSQKSRVPIGAVLPLTPQKAVVGSGDSCQWDLGEIPIACARCSHEFFVAADGPDRFRHLGKEVRSSSNLISRAEIESALKQLVEREPSSSR